MKEEDGKPKYQQAHGELGRLAEGRETLTGELTMIEKQHLPLDVELTYKIRAVMRSYSLDILKQRGECPMCGADKRGIRSHEVKRTEKE